MDRETPLPGETCCFPAWRFQPQLKILYSQVGSFPPKDRGKNQESLKPPPSFHFQTLCRLIWVYNLFFDTKNEMCGGAIPRFHLRKQNKHVFCGI